MSSTREASGPERKALRYLQKHAVAWESRLLVACSGGPDSQSLLYILHSLSQTYPMVLAAAHLDHGIRSWHESEEELDLVRRTCRALAVELVWDRVERGMLASRARALGAGLEETARQARYEFLRRAAAQTQADFIALGHTADDQVETLIMRFFQGVDVSGLAGIPEMRDNLIRPLIRCTRQELLEYLHERGAEYRLDSSNQDLRYLRNAVRLRLIPFVQEVFPGFRGSLLSLSGKLGRLRAFVRSEAGKRLHWKPLPGAAWGYHIGRQEYLSQPGVLRLFSLKRLLESRPGQGGRIPYRFLRRIEDDEYLRSRRVVLSGYGICLFQSGGELVLSGDVVGRGEKGYFINVGSSKRAYVPAGGFVFAFDQTVGEQGPMVLRSATANDTISSAGVKKRVRKLLSEWQVPPGLRWRVAVLEDRQGTLAVLGSWLGYKDRFREGTPPEQRKAFKSMLRRYEVEVE